MARSFYDDPENSRVTAVIASPCKATLLRRAAGTTRRSGASRTAVFQDSEAMHCVRLAKEERLTMALKYVFEQFNKWEGGVNSSRMDKMRFHKVLRCGMVSATIHRQPSRNLSRMQVCNTILCPENPELVGHHHCCGLILHHAALW